MGIEIAMWRCPSTVRPATAVSGNLIRGGRFRLTECDRFRPDDAGRFFAREDALDGDLTRAFFFVPTRLNNLTTRISAPRFPVRPLFRLRRLPVVVVFVGLGLGTLMKLSGGGVTSRKNWANSLKASYSPALVHRASRGV